MELSEDRIGVMACVFYSSALLYFAMVYAHSVYEVLLPSDNPVLSRDLEGNYNDKKRCRALGTDNADISFCDVLQHHVLSIGSHRALENFSG